MYLVAISLNSCTCDTSILRGYPSGNPNDDAKTVRSSKDESQEMKKQVQKEIPRILAFESIRLHKLLIVILGFYRTKIDYRGQAVALGQMQMAQSGRNQ